MGGVVLYEDKLRQHLLLVMEAFRNVATCLLFLMTSQHHVSRGARSAELRSDFYNDFWQKFLPFEHF